MKRLSSLMIIGALAASLSSHGVKAQGTLDQQQKQAAEMVDTAKFKKAPPYTIGVSAGYMSNSWVVFSLQNIKYEASLDKNIKDIVVTDAGFKPAKQVADIEDLINKQVSAIIYWPVDDKSIEGALKKAEAAGIPTVNAGGGFTNAPGTTTNAPPPNTPATTSRPSSPPTIWISVPLVFVFFIAAPLIRKNVSTRAWRRTCCATRRSSVIF